MAESKKLFDVVVVGSCVQDLVSYTTRFPKPGESVRGNKFLSGFGGKGANQAVMAGRLGAKTAMVAKIGEDMFGQPTIDNFKNNGVNAEHVTVTKDASTATASIFVDESGQNCIVVILGANMHLTVEDVRRAESIIAGSKVVLCQLETKPEVTLEALKIAKKHGVTTIFNPAPGLSTGLEDDGFYKNSDIICPNENEAEILTGIHLKSDQDVDRILKTLTERGAKTAIVTLGENGCAFMAGAGSNIVRVKADKVSAVDTTGAGDAFVGALAYFTALHAHLPLEERIHRAGRIASISVQKPGTQSSYSKREELPKELFD